jgi:hypothetical protein
MAWPKTGRARDPLKGFLLGTDPSGRVATLRALKYLRSYRQQLNRHIDALEGALP